MAAAGTAAALSQSDAAPTAAVHKTPAGAIDRVGGHPNFSGVWSVMNTANWDIEPHLASAALELRPGPVVPVPAKATRVRFVMRDATNGRIGTLEVRSAVLDNAPLYVPPVPDLQGHSAATASTARP